MRLHPCNQLKRTKRLRHVIISPKAETKHLIIIFLAGTQYHNVQLIIIRAYFSYYFKTVNTTHHNIKYDKIVFINMYEGKGFLTGISFGNFHIFFSQIFCDKISYFLFIINDKYPFPAHYILPCPIPPGPPFIPPRLRRSAVVV